MGALRVQGSWESPGLGWEQRLASRSLTPGIMLPVITELYTVGPWVEDVGTATLLDHALLEARMNAHLEEGSVKGDGVRPAHPRMAGEGRTNQPPQCASTPLSTIPIAHHAHLVATADLCWTQLPWKQAGPHLLRVLGIVKVLHRDLAAILGAVAIVAPESVHGFLRTQRHQAVRGQRSEQVVQASS